MKAHRRRLQVLCFASGLPCEALDLVSWGIADRVRAKTPMSGEWLEEDHYSLVAALNGEYEFILIFHINASMLGKSLREVLLD